jgi:hypothetical protein
MGEERRKSPRCPLGRVAAIMVGRGEEHPCLVKDYSDGGVRLQPNGFQVPDDFTLLFSPNEKAQSGRYKVVWRLGGDVVPNSLVRCLLPISTMAREGPAGAANDLAGVLRDGNPQPLWTSPIWPHSRLLASYDLIRAGLGRPAESRHPQRLPRGHLVGRCGGDVPDNSETQDHACTTDEQKLLLEHAEWGSLLDAARLIIAQGPDGERLARLVPEERNLAFLIRNEYADALKAFESAVSKITERLKQGLVESEGFHEDTGTRSSVTRREWQSRVIEIWKNRLINPLRGTRETYPWITDIEINLCDVEKALASAQHPKCTVEESEKVGEPIRANRSVADVENSTTSEKFERGQAAHYLTTKGHRISPYTLANYASN